MSGGCKITKRLIYFNRERSVPLKSTQTTGCKILGGVGRFPVFTRKLYRKPLSDESLWSTQSPHESCLKLKRICWKYNNWLAFHTHGFRADVLVSACSWEACGWCNIKPVMSCIYHQTFCMWSRKQAAALKLKVTETLPVTQTIVQDVVFTLHTQKSLWTD